jgi:hypothetical protein
VVGDGEQGDIVEIVEALYELLFDFQVALFLEMDDVTGIALGVELDISPDLEEGWGEGEACDLF